MSLLEDKMVVPMVKTLKILKPNREVGEREPPSSGD